MLHEPVRYLKVLTSVASVDEHRSRTTLRIRLRHCRFEAGVREYPNALLPRPICCLEVDHFRSYKGGRSTMIGHPK